MAVYTQLEDKFVHQMLAVYTGAGELVSFEGIAAGSINSSFFVEATGGSYFLRVNENKRFEDLLYERDLLERLEEGASKLAGVVTPRMLRNCVGGTFFPVDTQKYACLFPRLDGREVAVFEVTPEHCRQVGAFLARAHKLLRGFHGGRSNPYGMTVVRRWHRDMATHPLGRAHATRLAPHLEAIRKLRRPLPRGVVHGDLFVDNTKWRRGDLIAAFDWEMAGRDHLMLDLGVCLNAWCWMRDGGSGGFVEDRCRALVDGYQSVRPLSQTERRGLFVETLFAALRFTMSRIRDFELDPARGGERVYLDYRDFEARLETWRALGARAFQRTVLA